MKINLIRVFIKINLVYCLCAICKCKMRVLVYRWIIIFILYNSIIYRGLLLEVRGIMYCIY